MCKGVCHGSGCADREECESGSVPQARWTETSHAETIRAMASAVNNIVHAANAEGKAAMATIVGNAQAPAGTRTLAGIIANFNHMAREDEKAMLSTPFGL